jgi:hypothetical protein
MPGMLRKSTAFVQVPEVRIHLPPAESRANSGTDILDGLDEAIEDGKGFRAAFVSLCQFLPGPNIIGIAVCTGTKLRGAPGALAAIAGFLVLP